MAIFSSLIIMATGHGFGKVILFGEHFVVHGTPSIASGISRKTVAELKPGKEPGFRVIDQRPAAPGYIEKYAEAQKKSVELMNAAVWHLDFDEHPVEITLGGDLYCASGVGASAASCVAMARAVSAHFNLNLTEEQINLCGLEGDKAYAGTPSGIDNTCSTYGGLIYFRKGMNGAPNTMEKLALGKPLHILMVSTGITTKTEEAVAGLKKRMGEEPDKFKIIFGEAESLVARAREALAGGDTEAVGKLMDANHVLLQQSGVSHEKLDYLVDLCRKNHAIGAKMTGGGMGGYMVALFSCPNCRAKAEKACEAEGYKYISAEIG
jgi:mevalonate kinase